MAQLAVEDVSLNDVTDFGEISKWQISQLKLFLTNQNMIAESNQNTFEYILSIAKVLDSKWWSIDKLKSINLISCEKTKFELQDAIIKHFVKDNRNVSQDRQNDFQNSKQVFSNNELLESLLQLIKTYQDSCDNKCLIKGETNNGNNDTINNNNNKSDSAAHDASSSLLTEEALNDFNSKLEVAHGNDDNGDNDNNDDNNSNDGNDDNDDGNDSDISDSSNLSTHPSLPDLVTDSEDEEWEKLINEDMNSDFDEDNDEMTNVMADSNQVKDVDDTAAAQCLDVLTKGMNNEDDDNNNKTKNERDEFDGLRGLKSGFFNYSKKDKKKEKKNRKYHKHKM